jgi:hypothetical protein
VHIYNKEKKSKQEPKLNEDAESILKSHIYQYNRMSQYSSLASLSMQYGAGGSIVG